MAIAICGGVSQIVSSLVMTRRMRLVFFGIERSATRLGWLFT
ncbi:hypothetical protein ACXYN8_12050 [Altererythrobacter sp. CAU 1778]